MATRDHERRLLDQHTARRLRAVPTLSALCGPVDAGGRVWREWAAERGRAVVAAPVADLPRCLIESRNFVGDCLRFVALAGRPADHLRSGSTREFDVFWETVPLAEDDAAAVARETLRAWGGGSWPGGEFLSLFGRGDEAALRLLVALSRLVPEGEWPAVLALNGVAAAARLVTRWPRLNVAVLIERSEFDAHLAAAPGGQMAALLREGRIDLAEDVVGGSTASEDDDARSAAERLLFEALQANAETAGLFELNETLDFPFGRRPAEVDLLARRLMLAVELDGEFWHGFADSYRRDRRKDWELQRRGFLVLRFLSEDVPGRLEEILETIVTAVRERRGSGVTT